MTPEQLETLQALDLPDTIPKPLELSLHENDDGSFDVEWDENDPAAKAIGCNSWAEDQWLAFLEFLALHDSHQEWVVDAADE